MFQMLPAQWGCQDTGVSCGIVVCETSHMCFIWRDLFTSLFPKLRMRLIHWSLSVLCVDGKFFQGGLYQPVWSAITQHHGLGNWKLHAQSQVPPGLVWGEPPFLIGNLLCSLCDSSVFYKVFSHFSYQKSSYVRSGFPLRKALNKFASIKTDK